VRPGGAPADCSITEAKLAFRRQTAIVDKFLVARSDLYPNWLSGTVIQTKR